MADIDREQIQQIADLAHLSLSDDEVERMSTELGAIIAFVQQLREVDIEGVPPTTHVLLDALPLRPDRVAASLDRDLALNQAPEARDGSFAVAAFVDEG